MVVDYEHCLDCINDSTHYILYMIDYNLIMYIGIGLITFGFLLFIFAEMRIRECDRQLAVLESKKNVNR